MCTVITLLYRISHKASRGDFSRSAFEYSCIIRTQLVLKTESPATWASRYPLLFGQPVSFSPQLYCDRDQDKACSCSSVAPEATIIDHRELRGVSRDVEAALRIRFPGWQCVAVAASGRVGGSGVQDAHPHVPLRIRPGRAQRRAAARDRFACGRIAVERPEIDRRRCVPRPAHAHVIRFFRQVRGPFVECSRLL